MSALPIHTPKSPVTFKDDGVSIDGFHVRDPEFVAIIRESENPEQTTHECLSIGARALRSVQTTVDAAIVDKRFGEFETKLDRGTREAVQKINAASESYLDPESGELRKMFDVFKGDLDKSLGETFDPESKQSVLAKFEKIFGDGTRDLGNSVRQLIDPGNPESPLGRLRTELTDEFKDVRKSLDDLGKQVAVDQAAAQASAEVLELSAIKGRKFEEVVFESVSEFAALYHDEPDAVGSVGGSDGNNIGDIVISLNAGDAPIGDARYVVEAKDKKLGLRAALDELDHAIANRSAKAGVIVFASQDKAPISVPCRSYGNKVIVVLDKEEMDTQPLRLALMNARLTVQREFRGSADELDLEAALTLVDEGQRALDSHSNIKRCHTAARNQIESAASHTGDLVERIESILHDLGNLLKS
ncbi:MAG: hypothetical protein ACYDA3_01955 [Gaiellaceae bacterium]